MNTMELATKHPKAYEALPDAYQGDDCLFFYEADGKLFCKPMESQEGVLGKWVCVYIDNGVENDWSYHSWP